MYTNLLNRVNKEIESRKEEKIFYIEHGYMTTWNENEKHESDRGIQQYSTATRWEQYKNGEITREKAIELATKRMNKQQDQEKQKYINRLEAAYNTKDINIINISTVWKRSSVWGYNPHTEVTTNYHRTEGSASGCGYDKHSAAVASALNENNEILKLLYDHLENYLNDNQLKNNNSFGDVFGYGSGYGILPYFEGGTGYSCVISILKKLGFEVVAENSTASTDFTSLKK